MVEFWGRQRPLPPCLGRRATAPRAAPATRPRGASPCPRPPPSLPTQSRAGARRADNGKRIRNSSPKFFLLGAGGGIGRDTAAQRGRRPPTPWPRGAHSSASRRTEEESPRPFSFFPASRRTEEESPRPFSFFLFINQLPTPPTPSPATPNTTASPFTTVLSLRHRPRPPPPCRPDD